MFGFCVFLHFINALDTSTTFRVSPKNNSTKAVKNVEMLQNRHLNIAKKISDLSPSNMSITKLSA